MSQADWAKSFLLSKYTMGFRHPPQSGNYQLLPTFWHELTLRPAFFFDSDPGMTFNPGTLPASGKSGTQQ